MDKTRGTDPHNSRPFPPHRPAVLFFPIPHHFPFYDGECAELFRL
jgi:hypothetical protein